MGIERIFKIEEYKVPKGFEYDQKNDAGRYDFDNLNVGDELIVLARILKGKVKGFYLIKGKVSSIDCDVYKEKYLILDPGFRTVSSHYFREGGKIYRKIK